MQLHLIVSMLILKPSLTLDLSTARYNSSPTYNNSSNRPTTSITVKYTNTLKSTTVSTLHDINEVLNSTVMPWWYKEAIKDIAYYMRMYKFNEYDRRYETKPERAPREYFKAFPKPPLRSLHWEVHKHCEASFLECVDYLRKKLSLTALKREDDTAVVVQEQKWNASSERTMQIEEECKKMRKRDDLIAKPFEGPLERYQWRITASYYMCWYTMNEVPDLQRLNDTCDNFAYCLDATFGTNNKDPRARDGISYSCAMYSFCPDPCCPNKHLTQLENCWNSPDNPCFQTNPAGKRECVFNRSQNTEFSDIVLNRWNVTCQCPQKGYVWSSLYGMCVDIDECSIGSHNCHLESQTCVNLAGSFRCVCKWGYYWDISKSSCIASEALSRIKLEKDESGKNRTEKGIRYAIKRIKNLFRKSEASTARGSNLHYFVIFLSSLFACGVLPGGY